MNPKSLLLIALLLVLVALINYLTEEGVKRASRGEDKVSPTSNDYYLNDFYITVLDQQGRPQHRLEASQLSHPSQGRQTHLQQPRLELYQNGKVAWQVSANRGEVGTEQQEVELQGDVVLRQLGGNTPLQLTTPSLLIQPDKGRASTKQAVTLRQAKNRIEAIGMKIEQQSQRLTLLSHVRGYYENLAP